MKFLIVGGNLFALIIQIKTKRAIKIPPTSSNTYVLSEFINNVS